LGWWDDALNPELKPPGYSHSAPSGRPRCATRGMGSGRRAEWRQTRFQDLIDDGVQAAVRLVLRKKKVRHADFEPFFERIMEQAEAQYEDWPQVA